MSITGILKVLMLIVAFLLIIAIMMQRSKGSGLRSTVNANKYMGVQKSADLIEKSTWILAIILFGLGITLGLIHLM